MTEKLFEFHDGEIGYSVVATFTKESNRWEVSEVYSLDGDVGFSLQRLPHHLVTDMEKEANRA